MLRNKFPEACLFFFVQPPQNIQVAATNPLAGINKCEKNELLD